MSTLQTITEHVQELIQQELPEEYYIRQISMANTTHKHLQAYSIQKHNGPQEPDPDIYYVYEEERILTSPKSPRYPGQTITPYPYSDPQFPKNFIDYIKEITGAPGK